MLGGIKHSGKSTVGKLLSDLIGADFHDLDSEIEKLASHLYGRDYKVRSIMQTLGKDIFMQLESTASEKLSKSISGSRMILALGGGTIDNPAALDCWESDSIFIFLDEQESVLFDRILSGGLPPFLEGPNPKQLFHELFTRRRAAYRSRADKEISVHGFTPTEVATQIAIWLNQ